ncbi:ErfK/YbiS/YcfS/YnhG family protein [Calothrix sp. NIES-2100]|uniref:L,D-transpeptidase n=1 Tax=Calothrix sp. NIES-2100 TaxID=1954172 RepID=UPI000B6115F9|nr:ErfK/YbiS/YcfS/YnhG family protein [Calothrix sp. NIES-2100]
MVRNESVTRIIMWLCFGTAILSLAVHWRVMTTGQQFEQQASTKTSHEKSSPGGSFSALGASVPPGERKQRISTSQSSATKLHNTKSGTASKNVAIATDESQITPLVSPEKKLNPTKSFLPQSLLPQVRAQLFNTDRQISNTRQVVVDLSDRRAYVYHSDVVIASYPIAVGKKGWETPTGSFQVMHKQHNPIWRHPITDKVFAPGTDSPLGDRWIGFWSDGHNEIGFHGTPDTNVMGTAISHGCLRMRNPDVRLLYQQVSVGTPVIVRE